MADRHNQDYNPELGNNVFSHSWEEEGIADIYPDVDELSDDLNRLIQQLDRFNEELEEDLLNYAVPIDVMDDEKLREAHRKEWPSDLGVSDHISYRYYKALRFKNTASASYIRKRYEEAVRDVGGTPAIDIMPLVDITKQEALLVQEFLNDFVDRVDDSSEQQILELFQGWVKEARGFTREFRERFLEEETRFEGQILVSEEELERLTPEEATQGQAVFKSKLNYANKEIVDYIEFLKEHFADFSSVFYKKFLGPSLDYRLKIGRRSLPTGSKISQEIESNSIALDSNLRMTLADQMRRRMLYSSKVNHLLALTDQRDRYRSTVEVLAAKGKALKKRVEENYSSQVEAEYWDDYVMRIQPISPEEEDVTGRFDAPHSLLDDLDANDHPQYLLRSGGTIEGDIDLAPGALIDGMRPGTHSHTGEDGTPQIDGKEIIRETLRDDSVDTSDRPETPEGLRILGTDLITIPPGLSMVDVKLGWEGSSQYTYEVQVSRIPMPPPPPS